MGGGDGGGVGGNCRVYLYKQKYLQLGYTTVVFDEFLYTLYRLKF